MRLMFASHSSDIAGAELCLVVLVEEAAARGHTGVVTVPREGPLLSLLRPFENNFPIVIQPVRPWMGRRFSALVGIIRLGQALFGGLGFYRLLGQDNFDLVVVNSSVIPAPLLAARAKGITSLLIVRESIISNPNLRSALPRRLIRRLLSAWATESISNSRYIAEQFHYKCEVIYPELARSHFDVSESRRDGDKSGSLQAVMLGTLSPEKGQLDAVQAIAHARSRGKVISLDIYGSGSPQYANLIEKAIRRHDLGDLVKLHAPTGAPRSAFRHADLSIVCSRNEAFGMVTAESVLAGTPVIGYNRGGTAEILSGGGGLLTEADAASLADALIEIEGNRDLLQRLRLECKDSELRELLYNSPSSMLDAIERLA